MPTARCKWCNSWLFNEDIGREYIQVKSGMKIQSKWQKKNTGMRKVMKQR